MKRQRDVVTQAGVTLQAVIPGQRAALNPESMVPP
jgi:hypothetical protein